MMKRKWLLATLILTIGILLLLSGCNKDSSKDSKCESCTFGEFTVLDESTCAKEGAQTRTCSVCGNIETTPIKKLDHTYGEWVTATKPTVEAEGLQTRTCSVCGDIESEELPKLTKLFSIRCKSGNKTTVVYADENGNYTVAAPLRIGYDFAGWKTEDGKDFAATGKINGDVKIIAQWSVSKTTTFEELKAHLEGGAEDILLDADIVLSDTIYVVGKSTVYTTEDHTLTRDAAFIGDLFVLGQDASGKNSILITGDVASLTLRSEEGAKLTLDGNKESMTSDAQGTAFLILDSSTLNLYDDITITNCKKVGNVRILDDTDHVSNPHRVGGAAAIVADGVLNLYGATISNCEVNTVDKKPLLDTDGNQVLDEEGKPMTIYNDSNSGGAIFNRSTVNMYSGTISGCHASRGAAIFNYRVVNLKGGVIEDNYAATYGGALYLSDSQYAYASIGDSSEEIHLFIRENSANGSGGAIFGQHQSSIQIYSGVEFNANQSVTSNGGAINMPGALTITGGRFINNTAASKGGAVYAYYSNPEQTLRDVAITGGLFEGNRAAKGGAIGIGASESTYSTGAKVTVSGATFKNNTAFMVDGEDGEGGAFYVFWCGHLTIGEGTTVEGNTAEYRGGAIYLTSKGSTVTVNGSADAKAIFKGNTAADNGGAIYAYKDTTLTVDHASFLSNKASGAEYGGGALYSTGAEATFKNTLFEKNASLTKNGGAICAYSSSVITLKDVTFTENTATDNGGAICLSKSDLTATGVLTLNKNVAVEGGGGAVYLSKGATEEEGSSFTAEQVVVTENTAKGNGGALYLHTNSVTEIASLTATANVSDEYGGAIYASTKKSVTLTYVTANGNEATTGGFLYLTTGGTEVTILGGSASDNVASGGSGATAYSNSTSAVLKLPETGFTYPENSISGKSGFSVTVLPEGGAA